MGWFAGKGLGSRSTTSSYKKNHRNGNDNNNSNLSPQSSFSSSTERGSSREGGGEAVRMGQESRRQQLRRQDSSLSRGRSWSRRSPSSKRRTSNNKKKNIMTSLSTYDDESVFEDRSKAARADRDSVSEADSESQHTELSKNIVFSYGDRTNTFADSVDLGQRPQNKKNEMLDHNHVNSLFNGHLMKWKFEAEEGTFFLRIPAFLGALASVVVSGAALCLDLPNSMEIQSIVLYVCALLMSLLVLILDGRFLSSHPMNIRSHLRNLMTRNFSFLRFLWGRGFLYTTIGILLLGKLWRPATFVGGFMTFIGVMAVSVGYNASRKFASLRNSLADESFLLLVFSAHDTDRDGFIDGREFSQLIIELGVELDDRYTMQAFSCVDSDEDRLVSFEDFRRWWLSGFVERGRGMAYNDRRIGAGDDEGQLYHQMGHEPERM